METYIVTFIGGPLDGQKKEVIEEIIAETLGAEELNEYSLGATRYEMHDQWWKNGQKFAEYRVVE